MKKAAVFVLLIGLTASAIIAAPKLMHVQFRVAEIRDTPDYLGEVIGLLNLNDQVTVLETQKKWTKIITANGKITGWVSSVTIDPKAVKMETGGQNAVAKVSESEMGAATSGLTEQIEKEYQKKHAEVDFKSVDAMEKIRISPAERKQFLKEGKVQSAKGGVK